jgi:exodeoxyribonuclease-5
MLTPEQTSAVRALLDNRDRDQVQTLGGYAGCGKTTCLAYLAEELPGWAPCAFTGKAAHVMRTKGMGNARTIHSCIYHPVQQGNGQACFVLRPRHEIGCEGFLVDEASMVSRGIHDDLLSFGLAVIFVGDHGQLPPVGCDINLMESPRYWLEAIHRNAGPIAHFAQHLRKGSSPRSFEGCDAVRLVGPCEVSDDRLLDSGQILCAFNKTRCEVNRRVRSLLGRRGEVEPGDRVMCLRNHREAGVFNGMQGRVVSVHQGRPPALDFRSAGVLFERLPYDPAVFGQEKPEIRFHPDAPHPFDFCYCITTHKAQGDEWKRVLVLEQRCQHWEHARWAYTAASRARERLTWVCEARSPSTSWPARATVGRGPGRGAHHE